MAVSEARKAYLREYQKRWCARRRAEWLEENGPCVDCGSEEELHVDHVDPSQKVSHRVWSWSKERMLAELAKCVVRCCDCHKRKTREHGEHARGERASMAKLTASDVLKMRELHAQGQSYAKVGERYGVNKTTARRAILGLTWSHVAVG